MPKLIVMLVSEDKKGDLKTQGIMLSNNENVSKAQIKEVYETFVKSIRKAEFLTIPYKEFPALIKQRINEMLNK